MAGTTHISRDALQAQALALLETHPVLLIAGPAGSGKSAVAKSILAQLRKDSFCLAFRAEEFAEPYIDKTLLFASVTAARLTGLLSGQHRNIS
ncbi:MAG: hypothetical protein H7145_08460 [Akkermansiaceae bacterium]|nr:hypothetical protein [Armatimonadota bacterium]